MGLLSAPAVLEEPDVVSTSAPRPFADRTGVSPAGASALAVLGVLLVVTTTPGLFRARTSRDWPGMLDALWRATCEVAGALQDAGRSEMVEDLLAIGLHMGAGLVLALPFSIAVAVLRSRSFEPAVAGVAALVVGILAVPLVAWIVRVVAAVVSIVSVVVRALGDLLAWLADVLAPVFEVVGWIGAVALGVGVVVGLGWVLRELARWLADLGAAAVVIGVLVAGVVLGLGWWLFDPLLSVLAAIGHGLAWLISGIVVVVLAIVVGLAVLALAAAAVVAAVLVLAQLGASLWTPFTAAWHSGARQSHLVDFLAGTGIAVSVVLTASHVAPGFRARLADALLDGPLASVVGRLPTAFGSIFPSGYEDELAYLFRGFTGVPEVLLVVVACAVGHVSLWLTSRSWRPDGWGRVMTVAFVRVLLALAAAAIGLMVAALVGDLSEG